MVVSMGGLWVPHDGVGGFTNRGWPLVRTVCGSCGGLNLGGSTGEPQPQFPAVSTEGRGDREAVAVAFL